MIRALYRKLLSTELGVLGGEVAQLAEAFRALNDDHSALKERFERFQNKSGMRWARQPLTPDPDLVAALRKELGARPGGNGSNPDFPDL